MHTAFSRERLLRERAFPSEDVDGLVLEGWDIVCICEDVELRDLLTRHQCRSKVDPCLIAHHIA